MGLSLPDSDTAVPVILVVEDEPLLRMMAVDMVGEAGFVALEAGDSHQAIAILQQRTDIRIVFTDIDLPGGVDGMKLAATIRDRWPPIKLILTSGHLKPADVDMPAHSVFYPKPYAQDRVMATMQAMAA